MKKTLATSRLFAVSLVLTALFAIIFSAGIATADTRIEGISFSSSICERFSSLSHIFRSCQEDPSPPPPPADMCPNVPGTQTSAPCADEQCAEQGGTWNGISCMTLLPPDDDESGNNDGGDENVGGGRNMCQRYILSSRLSPPQSCDVCPNVAGVQLVGQCADILCEDEGGTWENNSCAVPPLDVCPNVPGLQGTGPCADQTCTDDGGTWDGSSCEFPPFVRITHPNGDEVFNEGDVVEITWEGYRIASCFLGYTIGPGSMEWINTNVDGTSGSYTWTVEQWLHKGLVEQQKIYITCTSPFVGSFEDYSDDYFTVIPIDVCLNVPGAQSTGPCADETCSANGGTWNEGSCVFPPPPPACSDGIDNDSDGDVDFPADTGCSSADDDTETISDGGGAGAGGGGSASGFTLSVGSTEGIEINTTQAGN